MNVFYISSWYPSSDYPLCGIFIRDQIEGVTRIYPEVNAAVSIWGQQNESHLLYYNEPVRNLVKVFRNLEAKPPTKRRNGNLIQYSNLTFTWTKSLFEGNFKNILRSNDHNFQLFQKEFGKCDLIHAFVTYPGGYIAMKLSEMYGIPYVITEQISPFTPKFFLNDEWKIKERVIKPLQRAERVIAISPFSANQIGKYLDTIPKYIPNLVDEGYFRPDMKCCNDGKIVFFSLGRMEEQKGFPDLLKAWQIIEKEYANIELRIGGDGSYYDAYKTLSEKLNLKNVKWLGSLLRERVLKEMNKSDIFILSSVHESMGVVFAEAIACGKPIVATNCGGAESIVNQNNGLLAQVGNSYDIADKIRCMIKNYKAYDSELIREDFLLRFSRPVVSSMIMEVYTEAIQTYSKKE